MTLTDMRYLITLEKERHFGKAAMACYISQPTLSVAIKKLEQTLNITLFERQSNSILPTPLCLKIVAQAKRVLSETENIADIIKSHQDQLSGILRLGAIYTIGPYLLPNLLPLLRKQFPQMPLYIRENYTSELSRQLKNGELDVIVISLPFNEPNIKTAPVYDEPFVVLLPNNHPWQRDETIEPQRLSQEPVMLLGAGHCFRDQVLEICPDCLKQSTESNDDLQSILEGSSLETIRYMVEGGLGITILPYTAARTDRFAQSMTHIKRFTGEQPKRRVALAWRANFPRLKAIQAIHTAIQQCGINHGVNPIPANLD